MSAFLTVFLTVFLAEVGDKTQLATVLFSSDGTSNRWVVFSAASIALMASSAIAVLLGAAAEKYLAVLPLNLLAGIGFVLIGLFMIIGYFQVS
ncbi:TMEM165/GDT1 family protein [Litorimonas sp.]|uniref:TMEM165/GDT1 family protein n=1 Tax=Litorimonas sp. TaxID=1892381 RepID=UPI003A8BA2F4